MASIKALTKEKEANMASIKALTKEKETSLARIKELTKEKDGLIKKQKDNNQLTNASEKKVTKQETELQT